MIRILMSILLCLTIQKAEAQRVYMPEKTGSGDVEVTEESLVYILRPEKIQDLQTSEDQVYIQLKDSPSQYFYTLTVLNKGKKLTIKTTDGETVQSGIVRQAIDSGLIISKPIKGRINLAKFVRRIKKGKEPIIIEKMPNRPNKARFVTSKPEEETPKASFENSKEMKAMREKLEQLN